MGIPSGGYQVDPDTVFRSSVQFLDTKDFVFDIAAGTAADLSASAGMAGDGSTAHSFAAKYEPAARTVVQAIGSAGQGMATISSRLLAMATNYLAADDAIAAQMTGKVDASSGLSPSAHQQQCEPSEAYNSLPMVTGSKEGPRDPGDREVLAPGRPGQAARGEPGLGELRHSDRRRPGQRLTPRPSRPEPPPKMYEPFSRRLRTRRDERYGCSSGAARYRPVR
ncbi:hypothetical protein ABZ896_23360 [Streptomyces sp. NPDC047072]|uniref:hypothetical protein n=1 Tax=Streptomyces sp. NPDC047072 TaxID=3154809 RepID=UPI0033D14892